MNVAPPLFQTKHSIRFGSVTRLKRSVSLGSYSGTLCAFCLFHQAMEGILNMDPQSTAELRARLYSRCSWCAELIHRQQAKQPLRHVQPEDLLVHVPEHHGLWLEMLGIMDELLLFPPAR